MEKIVQFPRWAEILADSSLGPKEREGFKITIRWYLSWCARNSVGCSMGSARDFIEWAEEEKQPTEWMLKRWKSAIGWFFVAAWDGAEDGAKLSELMRLRVQDLDLKRNQVVVRCGKGGKDRVAPLSEKLVADIEAHLVKVRALFEEDLNTCHAKAGHGSAQSAG